MARVRTTFGTVAAEVGVGEFWPGGSKEPALQELLDKTLTRKRDRFCHLIVRIVLEGIKRRGRGTDPVSREEIDAINAHILKLNFKIPELHDPAFLNTLPSKTAAPKQGQEATRSVPNPPPRSAPSPAAVLDRELDELKAQFLAIPGINPEQQRGYAFERFLYRLFEIYALSPRASFKIIGEQIDGSFEFQGNFYLVEAKWEKVPVRELELLVLDGRVKGHSTFGRGVFFTSNNFSRDGVTAFQKGRPSAMVGFDGQDMYLMLEHKLPFDAVLNRKFRQLADEGTFHYPVQEFREELLLKLKRGA